MTDNDDLRERAKVEQIDRDAAADIQFRPNTPLHDAAIEGDLDHSEEVQAFARHRLAAIEALQQRVERLEVALRRIGNEQSWAEMRKVARAALGDDVG